MKKIFYDDLRRVITQQARDLRAQQPEYQSTEWYLLKYLRRIEKNLGPESSHRSMENSMRGFLRFYVDRVETDSSLGQRCMLIYQEYRRTRRMQREE